MQEPMDRPGRVGPHQVVRRIEPELQRVTRSAPTEEVDDEGLLGRLERMSAGLAPDRGWWPGAASSLGPRVARPRQARRSRLLEYHRPAPITIGQFFGDGGELPEARAA